MMAVHRMQDSAAAAHNHGGERDSAAAKEHSARVDEVKKELAQYKHEAEQVGGRWSASGVTRATGLTQWTSRRMCKRCLPRGSSSRHVGARRTSRRHSREVADKDLASLDANPSMYQCAQ